jgi:hypothetical protein
VFSLARCRSPLRLASSSRFPAVDPCPGRARARYPLVTFADATFAAVLPQRRWCRRFVSSAVPVRPLAAASPRPPTCPHGSRQLRWVGQEVAGRFDRGRSGRRT